MVELVHELVDAEIDFAPLDEPAWRVGLLAFARAYRAAFLRHPHAVALVTRRPMRSPRAFGVYDAVAGLLLRVGVPAREVMEVRAVLDYVVLGSTIDAFVDGFTSQSGDLGGAFPVLAAALRATDRGRVDADAFACALGLLVAEVERRLAAPAPAP